MPHMARQPGLPTWLPRYDVTMDCDLAGHTIKVSMRATWTNNYTVPLMTWSSTPMRTTSCRTRTSV